VRLDPAVHRAGPEAAFDRRGGSLGGLVEAAGGAGLDLAAQRRALAVGDRRDARGRGAAARGHGVDRGRRGEAGRGEGAREKSDVVVAVRRARQEARRVVGEQRRERRGDRVREVVGLDAVPHVEHERAARPQHAPRLGERLRLVGEEHGAELARDDVEAGIVERQRHRVGRLPAHRPRGADARGLVEHGGIEVGGDDRRTVGQRRQHARHHAGAGGDLEQVVRAERGDAPRQVVRVRLEDERHQLRFVELRDRAGKHLVAVGHRRALRTGPWKKGRIRRV
jgi:hypothetical protein